LNKIRYYLMHEEEMRRTGLNGQAKALARDTWDARLCDTFMSLGLLNS
jgi:hypothetical protein